VRSGGEEDRLGKGGERKSRLRRIRRGEVVKGD
jgi:hypothetical protein